MAERITWTTGKWATEGSVGGLPLFTVGYGTTRKATMYYLATTLPIRAASIGQHYETTEHAKMAAEKLLEAFIRQIDPA